MKIEKGVPIPPLRTKHFDLSETLMSMEVGDSIVVADVKQVRNVLSAKRFRSRRYTCRMMPEGVRFWRTE